MGALVGVPLQSCRVNSVSFLVGVGWHASSKLHFAVSVNAWTDEVVLASETWIMSTFTGIGKPSEDYSAPFLRINNPTISSKHLGRKYPPTSVFCWEFCHSSWVGVSPTGRDQSAQYGSAVPVASAELQSTARDCRVSSGPRWSGQDWDVNSGVNDPVCTSCDPSLGWKQKL